MSHGSGKLDVSHTLAANLGACNFNMAFGADNALAPMTVGILAAMTFPVLGRSEDDLAVESVLLGLQRSIIDSLRLFDLAVGPRANFFGGCKPNLDCIKIYQIKQSIFSLRAYSL